MKTTFLGKSYSVRWWEGDVLPSKYIALDTETEVVSSYMVPKLATCQVYSGDDVVYYIPVDSVDKFLERHINSHWVMHNAAFDIRVLEQHTNKSFLEKYKNGSIWDTAIMYRLLHLAKIGEVPFKYNLALLSEKYLGVKLDKDDNVRMEFGQFIGKENSIPENFLEYGAKDSLATYMLFHKLKFEIETTTSSTHLSHGLQVGADYVLKRIHENGIGFDLAARDKWLEIKQKEMDLLEKKLYIHGWMRGALGIRDTFYNILKRYEIYDHLPETDSGLKSTTYDDLIKFKHVEFVKLYLKYIETEKSMSFVKDIQTSRVHPRYNVIVNTGRTSSSKPNFQQLPKDGGIREMFVAAPGNTFLITDYAMLELVTLAQVCVDKYGESEMADRLNQGEDLHKLFASKFYNKDIKDVTKKERQTAKAANFGYPGGLGPKTFIEYAAGLGVDVDVKTATDLRDQWKDTFPEMHKYLYGGAAFENEGTVSIMTRTGRIRGNCNFCAAKNTPFQGLGADGSKLALFNLQCAGFKIVGFVHDEIITEVPIELAEEMLAKQEKIMIESMGRLTPDVEIRVESKISPFYTK